MSRCMECCGDPTLKIKACMLETTKNSGVPISWPGVTAQVHSPKLEEEEHQKHSVLKEAAVFANNLRLDGLDEQQSLTSVQFSYFLTQSQRL